MHTLSLALTNPATQRPSWAAQTQATCFTHPSFTSRFAPRPDGEQHWVEEVAAGKARLLDEGIEWRDGRADYHGPAGGPEGGRQEPAWLRAPHGSLLAAVAPASAPVAGAKAKKP